MKQFGTAERYLRKADPVLSRLISEVGPCRLGRSKNYFLTLVESIVWQQLSFKAAVAIHERMLSGLGTRRPHPRDFLLVSPASLRSAGLSRQKVSFVRDLAQFFEDGGFPRRRLHRLDDEEIIQLLTGVRGIGRWTAEMFLIFGLNRLDVFPLGDLGIRKAIGFHYEIADFNDPNRLEPVADAWRPYRTIATWYLWQSGDNTPLRTRRVPAVDSNTHM